MPVERDSSCKVTQPMYSAVPDHSVQPAFVEVVHGGRADAPLAEPVLAQLITPIGTGTVAGAAWEITLPPVRIEHKPEPVVHPAKRAMYEAVTLPVQPAVTAQAPVRAPTSVRISAQSPLLRAQALAAHHRGEPIASVMRITTVSRWSLLGALALALSMAGAWTALGQVEESSRARGILRAPFGVQPVVSLLTGTVREVLVESGAHVEAGQLLAKLDATPLQSQLQEAQQRLDALEGEWRDTRALLDQRHHRRARLMGARVDLLAERRFRQGGKIARRQAHAKRLAAPELSEIVEGTVREQSVDALEASRDEQLQLSDELSKLQLALVAAQSEHDLRIEQGEARVSEARTRRDAVQLLLGQTELRAPQAGKLESLRAQTGQVVQQGDWIARVVSEQSPHTIVAFAVERDVAFLRAGASAHVEIDQLPVVEFGLLQAKVSRVAGELADESELRAALGGNAPTGPHVRVELDLGAQPERVASLLRPGTMVVARITLRERRLLAIVFEPVRRWFL